MNTSDLRETLASHATFEDDAVTARVVGVRERVRVVRRRRRAAVGGAVAAVLAIGAAGVAIPKLTNSADPASRKLAGHTAPATLESLDAVYSFKRGVEGTGEVVLNLPKSDEARLVTWATAGDDNRVSVRRYGETLQSSLPDFTDFTVISGGSAERVTVSGPGRIAAAVYALRTQAPGVEKDGIHIPERLDGGKLVAAEIGDLGETELTTTFVVPKPGVQMRLGCTLPKGYVAHLEVMGGAVMISECDGPMGGDLGGSSSIFTTADRAGERGTARMWVVKGRPDNSSPEVTSDDLPEARLAFAIHSSGSYTGGVEDGFANMREEGGHRWRLASLHPGPRGDRDFQLNVDATDGPKYVAWYVRDAGSGSRGLLVDGKLVESWIGGDGGSSSVIYAGRHTLTIGGKNKFKPTGRIDYAVYERID